MTNSRWDHAVLLLEVDTGSLWSSYSDSDEAPHDKAWNLGLQKTAGDDIQKHRAVSTPWVICSKGGERERVLAYEFLLMDCFEAVFLHSHLRRSVAEKLFLEAMASSIP